MNAVGQLLILPFRRMPVGCTLVVLVWLGGMLAIGLTGETAFVVGVGAANWLWYMLTGMTLRTLMRPETLLLPAFRRRLAATGGIYAAFAIALPVALIIVLGGAAHALLAAALLVLAMAVGIATGLGMRITLLFWLVFLLSSWQPKLSKALAEAAVASAWTPLAATLLAALLLYYGLRPLLEVSDREVDESPLQAIADGRKPAMGADGTPRRRGWIGNKLAPLLNGTAQRALAAALTRFHRKPGSGTRMAVIRAVLLPHDNPQAVGLNLLMAAAIAAVYFFVTDAAQRWHAGYVGAYAVILGISRFSAVGRGMLKMRPNLADLYMTLAPATRSEFQATLADALLWLVGVAAFNCIAYAVLIVVLLHDAHPAQLLLAAGITGVGAAFGALAVHLIGPESNLGRGLTQFALMAGAAATYALVYWLIGRFGLSIGALGGVLITLPFGIGAWTAARKEYLQRIPIFDAPLS